MHKGGYMGDRNIQGDISTALFSHLSAYAWNSNSLYSSANIQSPSILNFRSSFNTSSCHSQTVSSSRYHHHQEFLAHVTLYWCCNKSHSLPQSRGNQSRWLGLHHGADKAGSFLQCVGCCQNLVPAVLGPKTYSCCLSLAVGTFCDFLLRPEIQAMFLPSLLSFCLLLSTSSIQEERLSKAAFSTIPYISPERPLFLCSAYCVPIVVKLYILREKRENSWMYEDLVALPSQFYHYPPSMVFFYKSQTSHRPFQNVFLKGLLNTSKQMNHHVIISTLNLKM